MRIWRIWKYGHILNSADPRAPVYVDIAHRAALSYSFAALVMMKLVEYSPYSETAQLLKTAEWCSSSWAKWAASRFLCGDFS